MKTSARRPFIAGNWKLNNSVIESLTLIKHLRDQLDSASYVAEVAIAPTFTVLITANLALEGTGIGLAGQDCYWESQGAFTGEISAPMLADVGCKYVIVGHSERRQYFGETDETVNRKVRAVLAAGLTPIVCVGETLAEREADRTLEIVGRQVRGALEGLPPEAVGKLVLAYEPVWAIGTGKVATSAQAQDVHGAIRGLLVELAGDEVAQSVRIQYGGSVKPDNAAELLAQPDVDGALVGGASLKAEDFAAIVLAAG